MQHNFAQIFFNFTEFSSNIFFTFSSDFSHIYCSVSQIKLIFPRTSREPGESNNWQLRKNCWRHRKIFLQTWKRTKIQTNTVPTELRTSFVFVEKTNWSGLWQTVCDPCTVDYTLFANRYETQTKSWNWCTHHE